MWCDEDVYYIDVLTRLVGKFYLSYKPTDYTTAIIYCLIYIQTHEDRYYMFLLKIDC